MSANVRDNPGGAHPEAIPGASSESGPPSENGPPGESGPPSENGPPGRTHPALLLLAAVLLFAATFALFRETSTFGFLNYDDNVYVTSNPEVQAGLTGESIAWAFGTSYHAANWHPVTWLSHMLDVELFGLDAGAHHRTSALLHALVAVLAFAALAALTRAPWASLFAAAFFAWHPLRAESVAWVAERKDVLAGLFWFATLWAYVAYARRPGPVRYAAVLLGLVLGLLSKPMAVTLPFLLLVLDAWPLRRTQGVRRLVLEKVPLIAVVVASCLVTMRAQRAGGALENLVTLPVGARVANAVDAYSTYIGQTLWPTDLALLYPHRGLLEPETIGGPMTWLAAAGLLVVSLVCVRKRHAMPWLATGWLWFLGTLVPVIGLVQVGLQSHADRYTYVPTVGLSIAVIWTLRHLSRQHAPARLTAGAAGALWLALFVPVTLRQVETWRSTETAMRHALEVTERNFMAHTNLAAALERARRLDEAGEHYAAALEIRPGMPEVHFALGNVRRDQGRFDDAAREFEASLAAKPGNPDAAINLGILQSMLGRDAKAVAALDPIWKDTDVPAFYRVNCGQALAWILATSPDDGVRDGQLAIEIASECHAAMPTPQALETLAAGHAAVGRFDEAVTFELQALESIPPVGQADARRRLELYRASTPYRRPPGPAVPARPGG